MNEAQDIMARCAKVAKILLISRVPYQKYENVGVVERKKLQVVDFLTSFDYILPTDKCLTSCSYPTVVGGTSETLYRESIIKKLFHVYVSLLN